MEGLQIDLCCIENPVDLFYLTGLNLSVGQLLVHKSGSMLFVDKKYIQNAQERAPVDVALEQEGAFEGFLQSHPGKKCVFDSHFTTYDRFITLQARVQMASCGYEFILESLLFKRMREIKDPLEIEKLKRSAELLSKGFNHICSLLKEGVTEKEIAFQFEVFCRMNGASKLSFESIIAFGANSAKPHYRAQDAILKNGDSIQIDIGVVLDSYHSDMSRVVFFGKRDPFLEKVYKIVYQTQLAALNMCRPGVALSELDAAARQVMRASQMEEHYLHSLGHGIGLEIHEFPRINCTGADKDVLLEPGMVITIEPGLYFPGVGGVRYEDTIVITETSYHNFYPRVPLEDT